MSLVEITQLVDARGLACPMPIVLTAKAMKNLVPGQFVELLATDRGSVKDVAAWSKSTGNLVVEATTDAAVYRFVICRK